MAKGIFALEDLENIDVVEEPVDEVEYIQAQNDLDDHSDVIDDLQEIYDNADQDSSVIGAVADSIPDTDDNPVESTIIATEALIRKLGLPNYSLESYKDKTNKALKASLETTIEQTQEAKKSLLKKIWEKIVAFFKKAYEFITGLFKKKVKNVKKKVDDLDINSAEEFIRMVEEKYQETKKEDVEHKFSIEDVYKICHIEKKDGKLVYKWSHILLAGLFISQDEIITSNKIDKNLIELEEVFRKFSSDINDLSHMDIKNKEFSDNTLKLIEERKQLDNRFKEDEAHKEDFYVEIPTKNEIDSLLDKVDNFSKKIAETENKILSILNKYNNESDELDVFEKRALIYIKIFKTDFYKFQKFLRSVLSFCNESADILKRIENAK